MMSKHRLVFVVLVAVAVIILTAETLVRSVLAGPWYALLFAALWAACGGAGYGMALGAAQRTFPTLTWPRRAENLRMAVFVGLTGPCGVITTLAIYEPARCWPPQYRRVTFDAWVVTLRAWIADGCRDQAHAGELFAAFLAKQYPAVYARLEREGRL